MEVFDAMLCAISLLLYVIMERRNTLQRDGMMMVVGLSNSQGAI